MKILIIEDEHLAADVLCKIVKEIEPDVEILTVLQTVEDSVEWFETHETPDLVFLDINLADGSSFLIFEKVDIKCPIIFTTAYNEYALKAFKVNSIDYLLKPISKEDVYKAMTKYRNLTGEKYEYSSVINEFVKKFAMGERHYKSYFLVPKQDKLIPLATSDIAYIFIDAKTIKAVAFDEKIYYLSDNLDELMKQLNPQKFFRANRQYIVSHDAIKDVSVWFGNKVSLNLKVPVSERIIVSKARVTEFKDWYAG